MLRIRLNYYTYICGKMCAVFPEIVFGYARDGSVSQCPCD